MNALTRGLLACALTVMLAVPALGQELQGTLRKIKDSGVFTIGYREQSIPFSFLDRDGKPAGYTVDLCTRIVAGLQQQLGLPKLDVKWVAVTPETRIAAVAQGTVDIECGSTTNTLSRQEQVDFSHMTFVDGSTLLIRKDSGIRGLADLGNRKIAVIPGTTTEKVLRDSLAKSFLIAQIIPVKEHREGLEAMENGTAEAYVSDRVLLLGLAVTSKDPQLFAIAEQPLSYEPYGLMVRRGDAPFRLAVNRVLSQIYRSGDILPIYSKWFGKMGPPPTLLLLMYGLHALPE
jgi:glutamate/aspartate transport system substrate-binding protein